MHVHLGEGRCSHIKGNQRIRLRGHCNSVAYSATTLNRSYRLTKKIIYTRVIGHCKSAGGKTMLDEYMKAFKLYVIGKRPPLAMDISAPFSLIQCCHKITSKWHTRDACSYSASAPANCLTTFGHKDM